MDVKLKTCSVAYLFDCGVTGVCKSRYCFGIFKLSVHAFVLFLLYKYFLNTRLQFRVVIFLRYELSRKIFLGWYVSVVSVGVSRLVYILVIFLISVKLYMNQYVFVLSKPADNGRHFVSLLFGLSTALI